MNTELDYDRYYAILKRLLSTKPNFFAYPKAVNDEDRKWLADLTLCLKMKLFADSASVNTGISFLIQFPDLGLAKIRQAAFNALSVAEMKSSSAVSGAFIPVGAAFDFHTVLTDILRDCKEDVFLVDPYMDNVAVTDVAVICPCGVSIRFLTDTAYYRKDLKPAVERWDKQHGATLEVRLTAERLLHDRLIIIDRQNVFLLSQSIKDFANRASGSVQKMDDEAGKLKASAYEALWTSAENI